MIIEKSILDVVKAKRNRLLIFPHSCEHEGNSVGNDAKIALSGRNLYVWRAIWLQERE